MPKPRRGGKREGAGRPVTLGATMRITITVSPDDRKALEAISPNLSEAVRLLIAEHQKGQNHADNDR